MLYYVVQCTEWDAYCWICHTEGSASDCCCELCPRLYHKKCLAMKTAVSCWVCPECEVCTKITKKYVYSSMFLSHCYAGFAFNPFWLTIRFYYKKIVHLNK